MSPPRYSILVNLPVFERFKSQEWDGKLGRRKSCKVQVQPKGASQPPNRMHERLHADKARSCVWSALRTAVGRATTVRRPCLVGEQRHAQRRLPKDILGVGGDEHHATSASAVCRIGRGLGALAWRVICEQTTVVVGRTVGRSGLFYGRFFCDLVFFFFLKKITFKSLG